MLLIPTGLDRTELRRTPWVTFGLLALTLATFLSIGGSGETAEAVHGRAEDVLEYLLDHPYLDPPPEFLPFVTPQVAEELQEARTAYLRATTPPVPMVRDVQREQLAKLGRAIHDARTGSGPGRLGFVPAHPSAGALVTSLFVHGSWVHLLGNLLFLWVSGPFLEDVYGRLLFLLLYLASGIAGTLVHTASDPHSLLPLVGASGAISGVMGAFLVRLGTARVRFLFLPIPVLWFWSFLRFSFYVPAFVVLPLWFVQQTAAAAEHQSGGVAFWAHVGGFAFGVLAAVALRLAKVEERWVDPGIEKEISWSADPALQAASDARIARDLALARRKVDELLARSPGDLGGLKLAYEIALDAHDNAEIGRRATRLLEAYAAKGERVLAHHLIREVADVDPDLPARYHVVAGAFLEKEGDPTAALAAYREAFRSPSADAALLRVHVRVATLESARGDHRAARAALEAARAHPACDDAWRRQVDLLEQRLPAAGAVPG